MAQNRIKKKIIGPDGSVLYPSEWLCAEDLQGKDVVVTIGGIRRSDVATSEGKTSKVVMSFQGKKKRWIICKTCANVIADMYGPRAKDWIGKQIVIYPTTCEAFGFPDVDCIRVRDYKPGSLPRSNQVNDFDDEPSEDFTASTDAAPPAAPPPTPAGGPQPSDLARDRMDQLIVIVSDAAGTTVTAKAIEQWLRSKWPKREPAEVLTEADTFEQIIVPLARKRWAAAAEPIEAGP